MKVFKNYINGEWTESRSGKTFPNINPANTDETVGLFQASNADDVNDACAARNAQTGDPRTDPDIAGYQDLAHAFDNTADPENIHDSPLIVRLIHPSKNFDCVRFLLQISA